MRNFYEVRMEWVNEDVSFHAGDDTRNQQEERPRFIKPCLSKITTHLSILMVPTAEAVNRHLLIGDTGRNADFNAVLVWGHLPAAVDQLFQHGCAVVFGTLDHRGTGSIPSSGEKP